MLFFLEGLSSPTGRAVHKDGVKLPTAGNIVQLKERKHGDKAIDRPDYPRLYDPCAGFVVAGAAFGGRKLQCGDRRRMILEESFFCE
jgi:hypothetical protein